MITILVHNNQGGNIERHFRQLYEPMPYITGSTLTVREFRGKSGSSLIWTDRRTMHAWNVTRTAWSRPIYVGYAFRRIGEGGHANQSQHYAGTAFDVAQNLDSAARARLRNLAQNAGVWGYVEPAHLTPTWVHFDARTGPPACAGGGYPMLREGSRSVYVCTLQDALETIGTPDVGIDGAFGPKTRRAVVNFQSGNGLVADGVVGCSTWNALTARANNFYRRSGTIPPAYSNE
jgi:hypothetical protein